MQAPGPLTQGTVASYRHYCGQDKALRDLLSLLAHVALISEGDNSAFLPSFSKVILSCQLESSQYGAQPQRQTWILRVLSGLRVPWFSQVSEWATKSCVQCQYLSRLVVKH